MKNGSAYWSSKTSSFSQLEIASARGVIHLSVLSFRRYERSRRSYLLLSAPEKRDIVRLG